ncbi:MAG TPA: PKD domain-containing protein [Methanospirillum sp.]|nr:PKD domain-containing protein [Methanospirillum sp.]
MHQGYAYKNRIAGVFNTGLLIGVLALLLFILPVSAEFSIQPVDLGKPSNFYLCHPSWGTFTLDNMASDFTADRVKGDAPFTVNFYDLSYGFPEAWLWDFGEGNTSEDQNPSYTYLEPGTYDVTLTIGKNVLYETTAEKYNITKMGQFTDLSWLSTSRKIEFITVAEKGSGTDQPIPEDFFPEPKNVVTMPSGLSGVVGNAQYDAATITLTPNTQKGYTDTMNITGAYRIAATIPYNNAY